jgi:hypothetical protein
MRTAYLVRVVERIVPLFLANVSSAPVRVQNVVGWVDRDRLSEEVDGLVVVFGREGLIALVFERGCLGSRQPR